MAGNERYYEHDLEWFVERTRNTDISTEHIRNTRDEIITKNVKAYLFTHDLPMDPKFEAWIEWTADAELCQLFFKGLFKFPHAEPVEGRLYPNTERQGGRIPIGVPPSNAGGQGTPSGPANTRSNQPVQTPPRGNKSFAEATRSMSGSEAPSPSPNVKDVPSREVVGKKQATDEQEVEQVSDADADLGHLPSDGDVEEAPSVVQEAEPLMKLLLDPVMDSVQLYAAVTEYYEGADNSDWADAKDDTLINSTHKWEIFKGETRNGFKTSSRYHYMDTDDIALFWSTDCPRTVVYEPLVKIVPPNTCLDMSMFEGDQIEARRGNDEEELESVYEEQSEGS